MWENKLYPFIKRFTTTEHSYNQAESLVCVLLSRTIQAKLKENDKFRYISYGLNIIELIKGTKGLSYSFKVHQQLVFSIYEA